MFREHVSMLEGTSNIRPIEGTSLLQFIVINPLYSKTYWQLSTSGHNFFINRLYR